ncbi:hypothetical protein SAMN06298216_2630 [Spirosomataceae bacterium TFI 002]|nr:hypothetical protein SAMN06298216_2630 [Spirosomataceae bacterium TFI 002]
MIFDEKTYLLYLKPILLMVLLLAMATLKGMSQSSKEEVSVSMPQVALMDIEPDNSTITFTIKTPTEAGQFDLVNSLNNVKWINYSSATQKSQRRGIYVQLTSGSVPKGTTLSITAANSSGGEGVLGLGSGTVPLSNSPKLLINNIGGAYTGNGANRGHAISYKLDITDVSKLDVDDSQTVTVSFTILDI